MEDTGLKTLDELIEDGTLRIDEPKVKSPQDRFRERCISFGYADGLYRQLQEKCYGQDEALKQASLLIYAFIRNLAFKKTSPRLNFIIEGTSGCGKTTFAKALQEILDPIPVVIADASMITAAGYTGAQSTDILESPFLQEFGYAGVVILDEADKLMCPQFGSQGNNYSLATLNNFLKMLDGDSVMTRDGTEIYCGRLLFICMGAFSDLRGQEQTVTHIGFDSRTEHIYQKHISQSMLADYGQSEQFVGRFVSVIPFNKPSMDVLRRVAIDTVNEISDIYGTRNLKAVRENIGKILSKAANSEFGCRNIRNDIWAYFLVHNNCFDGLPGNWADEA